MCYCSLLCRDRRHTPPPLCPNQVILDSIAFKHDRNKRNEVAEILKLGVVIIDHSSSNRLILLGVFRSIGVAGEVSFAIDHLEAPKHMRSPIHLSIVGSLINDYI